MSGKARILIAEDDPGVRQLIRTRLELAGYEAHTARNGREAIDRVRSLRPHAMVLDINMPEMDGFEVLEALPTCLVGRIPVLVLTARHASEDVRRAIGLGAKDYLTKPFNETQLLARVARILRPAPPAPPPPPGQDKLFL
jgi:DNA-binding response OmpR family regulator